MIRASCAAGCHSTPATRPIGRAVRRKSPAADRARLSAAVRAGHEVLLTCRIALRAFSRSRNSYVIDASMTHWAIPRKTSKSLSFSGNWGRGQPNYGGVANGPTR
jgi:hypothetical protein